MEIIVKLTGLNQRQFYLPKDHGQYLDTFLVVTARQGLGVATGPSVKRDRDSTKYPTMDKSVPITKTYMAQNVEKL